MKLPYTRSSKKGFTLVEIIISVTILSVFFVMAISTATLMIHNMRISEHRLLATYYAEDLLTWLRAERERDWDGFRELALNSDGSVAPDGRTYCINNAVTANDTIETIFTEEMRNNPPNTPCATHNSIIHPLDTNEKIYMREVNIDSDDDRIAVSVTMRWLELGREYRTQIASTFNFIE